MDKPAVSVVMSVYNGEPYVRAAVESILNQTFRDLELIVVDDGSTDTTPQSLAQISDPRLRVIRQPNRGQPAGLNAGLAAARAELITFMDGDDLCDPRRIEKMVAFLDAHPELGGVGTWEMVIDAKDKVLDRDETRPLTHEEIVREYVEGRNGLNGMSTMARAIVFRTVGGFRETLYMANDVDMWMRATERFRFACLPECLYWYRQHPQASNTARRQANQFYRALVEELRQERLATGTDRLARGETIAVPEFREKCGQQAYRESMAYFERMRGRQLARTNRWGGALRHAYLGWRVNPLGRASMRFALETLVSALFPFLRPFVAAPREELQAFWAGHRRDAGRLLQRHAQGAQAVATATPTLRGELIDSYEGLSAVAAEWDALIPQSDTPQSFFMTSGCILPFWRHHGAGRRLAVVLVRDAANRLVGAAPLYTETLGRGLCRHRRLALLGSPESGADYLDLLALPGYRRAVWQETFRCLRHHRVRWQALNLNYILDDSPSVALLRDQTLEQKLFYHQVPSDPCPYTRLEPTWDAFVATLGASTRRGIKYQHNLVMRRFQEVRFETVSDPARIPEVIRFLLAYKQAKYGHQFDHDYASWVDQATSALAVGQLRLLVLWLDPQIHREPACVWFTFVYNRRVFFQACSYRPEYANLRLGKVMMANAVRQAIEEGAIEYDMKRGDADYKYHWANGERRTIQIHATARTLRGAWLRYGVYGTQAVQIRKGWRRFHGQVRKTGRTVLAPIARRWPSVFPPGLGERLLRPVDRSEPQVALAE